jgi:hypothetical protein
MQFDLMTKDERRYFSPFAVIPIALNIYQFILYIPFGGVLNSFIQVVFSTVSITMSVNSIAYYMKNKKNGAKPPFVAYSCFGFITFEYIMWTSSCFDWPSEWLYPYNYACILDFAFYLLHLVGVNHIVVVQLSKPYGIGFGHHFPGYGALREHEQRSCACDDCE